MNDLESRVRDAFRGHEGNAPVLDPTDARRTAVRTRRRQLVNAAGAGITALAVAVSLTAGLGGLVRADRSPTPLDAPAPSPAGDLSTFSSALHRITIGYPTGWRVRPATQPWGLGRLTFDAPDVDVIFDPTLGDAVYLALVSQPLVGLSTEDWLDDPFRPGLCADATGGHGPAFDFDARRWVGVSCSGGAFPGHFLRVATDTRGYLIYLHVADERALEETYDEDFFQGLLDTVELENEEPSGGSS